MKFSKIFKTTAVSLGAVVALSGCIRETFPKESTITEGQLQAGQMEVVAENLLKGIPAGMLTYISGWEHTDYGYPSVGVYNDHACKLMTTNGWLLGLPEGYNRFYVAQYANGYGPQSVMGAHVWYNYYPVIKSCNDILGVVGDREDMKAYAGIAHTFRALLYLDLARIFECLYAEAPLNAMYESQQIKVAGLTVPIVDESTDEQSAKNNPRATREEMFKFILADLAFAEEALANYTPTSYNMPDLSVVYGLYARTYLWLGGFEDGLSGELPEGDEAYAKAAEYAALAIQAHGGAIMTENEWTNPRTGFNTMASSWMWALVQSTDTVINNLFQHSAHMCPEAAYGYGPLAQPGVNKKSYERLSDTDFRKKIIIGPDTEWADFQPYTLITEDEFASFAPYTFFKYRPGQGERNDYMVAGATTIPLMRCEEMYFIEMEAIYHTQGLDAAWEKLVQFMKNRDASYVCKTADVLDEIIFQKGIEFWGEGLLMFDMKRLDMGVNTGYEGCNYAANARYNSEGRLPWWTMCIPQAETQVNLALEDMNNPDPTLALKRWQAVEQQ